MYGTYKVQYNYIAISVRHSSPDWGIKEISYVSVRELCQIITKRVLTAKSQGNKKKCRISVLISFLELNIGL